MQSEEHIVAALRALAEEEAELEAPLRVEDRVRKTFRRRHAGRKWRSIAAWGLAAAAAVTVFFVAGSRERPKPASPALVRPQVVATAPAPAEIVAPAPERARQARPVKLQPREVVTEFFPLLDVALPFERGELLRVMVPASTMRKVGLPVNENRLGERVYADVLVGDEGLARAIRFVSYEQ
jgi:predicted acyl esterase